jgi:hypothetical protein
MIASHAYSRERTTPFSANVRANPGSSSNTRRADEDVGRLVKRRQRLVRDFAHHVHALAYRGLELVDRRAIGAVTHHDESKIGILRGESAKRANRDRKSLARFQTSHEEQLASRRQRRGRGVREHLDIGAVRQDPHAVLTHARADAEPRGLAHRHATRHATPHRTQERCDRRVDAALEMIAREIGMERPHHRHSCVQHRQHRRTRRERIVHVHQVG